MTIKEFINQFFAEKVEYNEDSGLFYETDFWYAWDKLDNELDEGGAQWCFEWYEESPQISKARENFIKNAVTNYIKKYLYLKYTNGGYSYDKIQVA